MLYKLSIGTSFIRRQAVCVCEHCMYFNAHSTSLSGIISIPSGFECQTRGVSVLSPITLKHKFEPPQKLFLWYQCHLNFLSLALSFTDRNMGWHIPHMCWPASCDDKVYYHSRKYNQTCQLSGLSTLTISLWDHRLQANFQFQCLAYYVSATGHCSFVIQGHKSKNIIISKSRDSSVILATF